MNSTWLAVGRLLLKSFTPVLSLSRLGLFATHYMDSENRNDEELFPVLVPPPAKISSTSNCPTSGTGTSQYCVDMN